MGCRWVVMASWMTLGRQTCDGLSPKSQECVLFVYPSFQSPYHPHIPPTSTHSCPFIYPSIYPSINPPPLHISASTHVSTHSATYYCSTDLPTHHLTFIAGLLLHALRGYGTGWGLSMLLSVSPCLENPLLEDLCVGLGELRKVARSAPFCCCDKTL